MVSRRTRTTLPTADHLLEPMSINRDTVSAEIKAKRNASKAYYDKTAGPEHTSINLGEFVYARPPTSKPGNPWAYGRVTGKRHSRSYTIQTPRSTIRRNRIHILVLRPSLRETTSGLPRSCCCCNTKSSWSSSGIKSVFSELSILFESSVPPDKSTVRKKMVTGTFTYNALRTKTLKERIKAQGKLVSHSNSTRAMLLV